jgi:hypothetical protein
LLSVLTSTLPDIEADSVSIDTNGPAAKTNSSNQVIKAANRTIGRTVFNFNPLNTCISVLGNYSLLDELRKKLLYLEIDI